MWAPKVGDKVRVLAHQPSVMRRAGPTIHYDKVPPIERVQTVKRFTPKGICVLDDGTKYERQWGWQLVRTKAEREKNRYSIELVPADTSHMREIVMSAMRFNGRRFASVGDITMFNGFEYYEVCELLDQLSKEGLAQCSFAREAECDWRLTDKGMAQTPVARNDLYESPEVAAERERLHDACGEAYELEKCLGPAWQAARAALAAFTAIHGAEYNPD